jgi:hypothetical protein
MDEEKKNWLEEMVERQALPEEARQETTDEFCAKHGISRSTYYYQASKSENQQKILSLALANAKKYAPEVLDNLGQRAKTNSKDAEMYLKFILQLKEQMDVTSGGLSIQFAPVFNKKDDETSILE